MCGIVISVLVLCFQTSRQCQGSRRWRSCSRKDSLHHLAQVCRAKFDQPDWKESKSINLSQYDDLKQLLKDKQYLFHPIISIFVQIYQWQIQASIVVSSAGNNILQKLTQFSQCSIRPSVNLNFLVWVHPLSRHSIRINWIVSMLLPKAPKKCGACLWTIHFHHIYTEIKKQRNRFQN